MPLVFYFVDRHLAEYGEGMGGWGDGGMGGWGDGEGPVPRSLVESVRK